jgi:uncharacterized membrane protein
MRRPKTAKTTPIKIKRDTVFITTSLGESFAREGASLIVYLMNVFLSIYALEQVYYTLDRRFSSFLGAA